MATAVRAAAIVALVLWVIGVSGAFSAALNWTSLAVGVGLVGLSRLASTD